jgi:opacity protein-like surface antigen
MKKLLLAVGMLVASGMVLAQSVTVQYQVQQNTAGAQTQGHAVQIGVSTPVIKDLANDFSINAFQADVNKKEFNRFEDGLTYRYQLNDTFTASMRGGLGYMESSNSGNWAYYVVEPKITAKLIYGFDASVAYRRRAAFNSAYYDDSNTMRYALGYHVTDKDYVRLMYDDLKGSNGNTYNNPSKNYTVAYTRNF